MGSLISVNCTKILNFDNNSVEILSFQKAVVIKYSCTFFLYVHKSIKKRLQWPLFDTKTIKVMKKMLYQFLA